MERVGQGGGEGEPLLCTEALQYCLGLEDKAAGMVGLSSHPTHKSYSSSQLISVCAFISLLAIQELFCDLHWYFITNWF